MEKIRFPVKKQGQLLPEGQSVMFMQAGGDSKGLVCHIGLSSASAPQPCPSEEELVESQPLLPGILPE